MGEVDEIVADNDSEDGEILDAAMRSIRLRLMEHTVATRRKIPKGSLARPDRFFPFYLWCTTNENEKSGLATQSRAA